MNGGPGPAVTVVCAIALTMTLVAGSSASAGHEGIHPAFSTKRVYFECPGPVANTATWSSNTPGSIQDRNGCGNLLEPTEAGLYLMLCREVDLLCDQASGARTTFVGTFRGNLRDMTLELYAPSPIDSGGSRMGPGLSLSIDGQSFGMLWGIVSPTSPGPIKRYEISIPGLGCAREVPDDQGAVDVVTDGFAAEDGTGSEVRHISISLEHGAEEWVWGAAEFSAGITFNPASLASDQYQLEPGSRADCDS